MMFMEQIFLGVKHFYDTVNQALAGAKIIKLDNTGGYIIDPSNIDTNWSAWVPGKQLVITSQAAGGIAFSHFIFSNALLAIGLAFFCNALLGSRQQSALELESRQKQYCTMLFKTGEPSWVLRLARTQKLVFSATSILVGLTVSVILTRLTVASMEKGFPGIGIFFRLSWLDLPLFIAPPLAQIGFGYLLTRRYIGVFLREFI